MNGHKTRQWSAMAVRVMARGWNWKVLLWGAVLLAGCSSDFGAGLEFQTCSRRRLDAATVSFEDSKGQMMEHYRTRSDTSLNFAYQASVDSIRLARSIRGCFDFDPAFKSEAVDLIRSNQILQRVIVSNMRDPDPGAIIGLFGDDYRDLIKKDIH